jgi:tetratricopeptide (TPR) repeat protein
MDDQTRQVYMRGKEAFERGDLNVAEMCLTHVLKKHRNYPDIYSMLGAVYHDRGRFGDAIRLFEKALELNPDFEETRLQLAVTLNDLGRYDKAREVLAHLAKSGVDPDSLAKHRLANKHAELGDKYMEVNQFDRARAEYKRALALRPNFLDIRRKLAMALRRLGRFEESKNELIRILEENPHYQAAQVDLGLVLHLMGDNQGARREWEAVVRIEPNNTEAKTFLAALSEGNPNFR